MESIGWTLGSVMLLAAFAMAFRCTLRACCGRLTRWVACCHKEPAIPIQMPAQQYLAPAKPFQVPPLYTTSFVGQPAVDKKEWLGTYTDLAAQAPTLHNSPGYGKTQVGQAKAGKRKFDQNKQGEGSWPRQGQTPDTL